jgi:hypothetical protein
MTGGTLGGALNALRNDNDKNKEEDIEPKISGSDINLEVQLDEGAKGSDLSLRRAERGAARKALRVAKRAKESRTNDAVRHAMCLTAM